ncbi:MAG: DUF1501 domain-containing protein [Phycisphaerae bacterium]|nr:DUF1501 domain-containing protein [Phycisphaerae bacterium]
MRITRTDAIDRMNDAERTLVVVFLRGGADGLTLVPPHAMDGYRRARPTLGVAARDVIDLDGVFGLHARMKALMPLWERGSLRIITGAGTADTSQSHFEAQDYLEHGGMPGAGWLARYLRARTPAPGPLGTVAIGTTLPESLRGAPGGVVIQRINDFELAGDDQRVIDALRALYEHDSTLGPVARATLDAERRMRALRGADDAGGMVYPDTTLGRGLREVARLIKADVGLIATTVDADGGALGWDTHFVQSAAIGSLMEDLAQSIATFVEDLGERRSQVTIIAMTEFGRRVAENTSLGTDHGAGSVAFMVSDTLPDGGGLHRGFTSLDADTLTGPGDVPVTTDLRTIIGSALMQHSPTLELSRVFARKK